jgi:tetratricopeptide (TPR) repeat protein
MNKRKMFTVVAAATALCAAAQINSPEPKGFLARGKTMYNDKNYIGTIHQLRHAAESRDLTDNEREQLEYCEAMSAFNLGEENAEQLLRAWLEKWGESPRRTDVLMSVGDCIFEDNYAEALQVYLQVDDAALLSQERRYDLYYRTGYCYMKLADYDKALNEFGKLSGSKTYANAAKFYKGYIAYARGDYRQAQSIFADVDTSTQPGCMADYYLSQIYYIDGDYNRALSTARKVLRRSDVDPAFTAEANRVAGESLYQTGNSAEAIPYLRKYVAATETPMLSSLYILGLSEYNNGDYRDAVNTLRPVTNDDSAMGQNAYVYVGQALMKLGDTDAAIMSFDRALKMEYDDSARETAFYNYAVAKYAGGNVPFGSSVNTFEAFVQRYPNSKYADDVRQYIISGYLTDNNYEAALASINRTKNPSSAILSAKQQVLYTLGSRNLASGNAEQAVSQLQEAKTLSSYNSAVARETRLSLGEALYRTGDYSNAATELSAYLSSTGTDANNRAVANYDLGYTNMALKKWSSAASNFKSVTSAPGKLGKDVQADAYTRLGDCYYYQKDWSQAATAYDKAYDLQPSSGDYALFQKAMMQGYAGNFNSKLSGLEALESQFPTSSLLPDAMLEMTEAQLRTGNTQAAITTYKRLISNYPNTTQGRQAYLQLALTYADAGRRSDAISTYRQIITSYPTSDEAAQAAETLKRMAAADGTLDEHIAFINNVDNAPKIDANEAEKLAFNAGEQAYLDNNATKRLEEYVKKYPTGKYAVQAYAYLMEAADNADDTTKSYNYACRIIENWPDNAAAVDAYAIKAEVEYSKGMGEEALKSWKELERRASTPADVNEARMGIMRVARDLGKADELLAAADAVLASSTLGSEDKTEAQFSRGVAQQLKGNTAAAISTWTPLASLSDDLYGAKSAVYLSQALLDKGSTAEAAKVAEKFINSGTPHTYWLGRGFIVLSDIYRKQGKKYEADEYLKALRENYPGTEADIFSMIDERLNK